MGLDLTISSEPDIVKRLINEDASVTLPDNIDVDSYWRFLSAASQTSTILNILSLRLRPAIGRMFLLASQNPELYTARGYKTFEEFIVDVCEKKLGISRALGFQAKKIMKAFPAISGERFQNIGIANLLVAEQFTDATQPSCEKHLQQAEEMSHDEFVTYAEQGGWIVPGSAEWTTIHVKATREIADAWEAFAADPKVQSVCGKEPFQILTHLLEEGSTIWLGHNLPMLVFDPKTRAVFDDFAADDRVHQAAGTQNRDLILMFALARCLETLSA